MPTAPPLTSSVDPRPVLVAALSGRALAAAARRAGDRVVVLDLFADCDTRELAERVIALPRGAMGFDRAALSAAVAALAPAVRGLVYGAGFEHDPALLAALAAATPLLGNAPETLAAVKHPLRLAELLARLGLSHPATATTPPSLDDGGWLCKSVGGAGGAHIGPASRQAATAGVYFQRRVRGRPLSALFVADGSGAHVLGFSEQWAAATETAPFRYGGCAGPVSPPPAVAEAITVACRSIARAAGLVGLNSLDLLVEGNGLHIIEVNPRPGATLDLFDGATDGALWRSHLAGVARQLSPPRATPGAARAAAVVYAPWDMTTPKGLSWPRWTADRGPGGTPVRRGDPICTVTAAAATVAAARASVEQRAARLLERLAAARAAPSKEGAR
jgi:uncharacterized protein